jgi:hexokinase
MEYFLREVKRRFEAPLELDNLLSMSSKLQVQFKEKLQCSNISMLPSYIHTLPTGHERGTYLSVDLGGSNLRVALVELCGKIASADRSSMDMVKIFTFRIDNKVRALEGHAFFDWMAERIEEAIEDPEVKKVHGDNVFPMGISWSFPVE